MSEKTPDLDEVRAVYANEFDSYHGYQWNDSLASGFDRFIAKVKAGAVKEAGMALMDAHVDTEAEASNWLDDYADRIEAGNE